MALTIIKKSDRLKEFRATFGTTIDQILKRHTEATRDLMKQLAPVSQNPPPGHIHMRDTIEVVPLNARRYGISIGAPYWVYVNYGTAFMVARPFVEPAIDSGHRGLVESLSRLEPYLR